MIKIISTLAVCYFGLLLLLYIFQRSLLYYPTDITHSAYSPDNPFEQFTSATHDGFALSHWKYAGIKDQKTIVFFHGNAGNAADRIPMMMRPIQEGYNIILAEYRGYGGNEGKPNEKDIITDSELLIQQLINEGLDEQNIILMGRSLGSGVAVQMATRFNISLLALISPYTKIPDVAASSYPFFPVRMLLKDTYNSEGFIKDLNIPILIFHGEADSLIPISLGRKLSEQNNNAIFTALPNYGHNNLNMDEINDKIDQFLKTNLTN